MVSISSTAAIEIAKNVSVWFRTISIGFFLATIVKPLSGGELLEALPFGASVAASFVFLIFSVLILTPIKDLK